MNRFDPPLRTYKEGDGENIVKMLNGIFGISRTVDHWRWQFFEHPEGRSWITLAEDEKGKLAGQYCMMRTHLNHMGQEICAGQSCDTMVRDDQRGKGLFVRMAEENYRYAAGKGLKAVFGFPNRASYPGFMRRLGWERIVVLPLYRYRTGCRRIGGPFLDIPCRGILSMVNQVRQGYNRKQTGEAILESSDKIPSGTEDLLSEIRNYEILSVWKDEDYINWRYRKNPSRRYRFHTLERKGELRGMIITRSARNRMSICEVLHRTRDTAESAILLNHVIRQALSDGLQMITFFGYDCGFYNDLFARCGFKKHYSGNYILGGRVFNDPDLERHFYNPHNWTIVFGDIDIA